MLALVLPSGRLLEDCVRFFKGTNVSFPGEILQSRRLSFSTEDIKILVCKPKDVPIYVEYGIGDLGIIGKDILLEQSPPVYELYDLGFGRCKLVAAIPAEKRPEDVLIKEGILRVATKYPKITSEFFSKKGISIEILYLSGSIELAPTTGLADIIVDIVSTGRTLKENNLKIWEEIAPSTARLIANKASLHIKVKEIKNFLEKIRGGL
ncbi:MAG: ATP phosphoribosyltransferase [bacterium]